MPSYAIHNPCLRGTSHVGNAHAVPKGELKGLTERMNKLYFNKVMVNGPTGRMNAKQKARVLAARAELQKLSSK